MGRRTKDPYEVGFIDETTWFLVDIEIEHHETDDCSKVVIKVIIAEVLQQCFLGH